MKHLLLFAIMLCFQLEVVAQCSTAVYSISENFDAYGNGPLPTCWTNPGGGVATQGNGAGYGGSSSYANMFSSSGAERFMVLPKVQNTNGILSFRIENPINTSSGTRLQVGVMTDPNDQTTFTALTDDYISPTSNYGVRTVNFANYTGTAEYIAFRSYRVFYPDIQGACVFWIDNVSYTSLAGTNPPIYVDDTAIGANNGTSWTNAYTNLQYALAAATAGDQIWVAEGTYTPDATDRKAYFNLPTQVSLYGGFDGTETAVDQRDPSTNISILSGDLAGNDNNNILHTEATRQDNSYHVIALRGTLQNVIVDGFTISGGNANGSTSNSCNTAASQQYFDTRGGAIYANPYVTGHSTKAKFTNCVLEKNTGTSVAVYSAFTPCGVTGLLSDVDFTSCIIRNNYSHDLVNMLFTGSNGYSNYGRGSIVNSLMHGNVSNGTSGSCLYLSTSTANGGTTTGLDFQLVNSTLSNNTSPNGVAIRMNAAGNSHVRNSIIYGNGGTNSFLIASSGSQVNNCIVEGGQQGGLDLDPEFTDAPNDDYTLIPTSPALNAGNNTYVSSSLYFDLAGADRIFDNAVDMGAYEATVICGKVVNLQATNIDPSNADITWDVAAGSAIYDLVYVESGQSIANGTMISGITTNTYTISGLTMGTNYDVQVGVLCPETGSISWSNPITFMTSDSPVYVNASATGANDGTSWTDAFTDLQNALPLATATKPVWVAAGTYTPHASDRVASFEIIDGSKIFGGFNGTEVNLSDRDPKTNTTILSGDLLGNDNGTIISTEPTRQDNSYHVVKIRGGAQDIVVDGFTISSGNANGGADNNCALAAVSQYYRLRGGAIFVNPYASGHHLKAAFKQCVLEKNTGTDVAVFSYFSPCGVTQLSYDVDFESCIVRDNHSQNLSTMLFSANNAFNIYGGGSLVNSLFYNNVSNAGASCVYMSSSTNTSGNATAMELDVINSTFANNTGTNGHVFNMIRASNCSITNSIVYGNGSVTPFLITTSGAVVSNSIVEGGQQGGTDIDPLFKDAPNHDYSLTSASPAIDAGDASGLALPSLDLNGNPRIANMIDMGAFETKSTIYVDHTATGANDGTSWADAFTDLQDALAIGEDVEIFVAKGTYKPTAGTGRGIAFEIPDACRIYGGYPNGGGTIRSTSANETILSGNVDNVASYAGNSFHVVIVKDVDDVILDGISIRDGNADNANSFGRSRGGGLFVNNATVSLNNTTVKWNKGIYGAGMFATLSGNVTVNESEFKRNEGTYGSAIYHSNQTNLYIIKSRIINNTSLNRVAIEVNNSLYTRIENSLIANNASTNANAIGFIATNRNGLAEIVNSTILGETKNKNLITMQVGFGDQLDLFIDNSIIGHQTGSFDKAFKDYNNGVLNLVTNNCYVQGSSVIGTATNNLYSSTDGVLMLNADYSLMPCSPGIDAGSNALSVGTTDIDGNSRTYNSTVDMGAFEATSACRLASPINIEEDKNLNKQDISITDIQVFPNPVHNQLFINTTVENLTFELYDILGKQISITNQKEIDMSQLPQGIYVLRIMNDQKLIKTTKIMKE